MQLKSDSAVCSLIKLSGFGERTPMGNGYHTNYNDHSPVSTTLEGFAKSLAELIRKYYSDYGTDFVNHAVVQAFALSTQPIAQGHLRSLGFQEHEIKSYGKYQHGISVFTIYPPDLNKKINEILSLKGPDALRTETFH